MGGTWSSFNILIMVIHFTEDASQGLRVGEEGRETRGFGF